MKDSNNKKNQISRRKILPILGGGLLIPLFGFGGTNKNIQPENDTEEEYKILLRPDGTTVKVKASTLKNLKVKKKNISNNSLSKWLKNKF